MSLKEEIEAYDAWLRTQCKVFENDLTVIKRDKMAESARKFMRATFFLWARSVMEKCGDLIEGAPDVPSVGDIHVENYGTWRNTQGQLVWGVNDFDEAAEMPWPLDPIRLLTSLLLLGPDKSGMQDDEAVEAVLGGYDKGLRKPRAIILDDKRDAWIEPLIEKPDEEEFWSDICKTLSGAPLSDRDLDAVEERLRESISDYRDFRFAPQYGKGGGSLGRPRLVAVGSLQNRHEAREAKAIVPSAWDFVHNRAHAALPPIIQVAGGKSRSPDPTLQVPSELLFVIRRIAPDARKLNIKQLSAEGRKLAKAMGRELGSIHSDSGAADDIRADLERRNERSPNWLIDAARTMAAAVEKDHAEFLKLRKSGAL